MDSDSIDLRRDLREKDDHPKILLTPEIVQQIPQCLAHFEVIENQNLLRAILESLDGPEPYGIHIYLYNIVFGNGNAYLTPNHQELLEDHAQKFLIKSSSLPSFPFLLFSNEACIIQLLSFLSPQFSNKKKCVMNFLCSIFDHNHQRSFIPLSIYKSIFELISENLDLTTLLNSILLYPEELPKDIFPFIAPIIIKHLQLEDIIKAKSAMYILFQLHEAQIPFDTNLILQCEERFINSIDENIISELINLIKYAPQPPFKYLERILLLVDTCNSSLTMESLNVLKIFGPYWNDSQKDMISNALMTLFNKSPSEDKNFIFTLMTVEVLLTIDRLPVNDTNFFSKVVEMIDVWDNCSVLIAIYTMLSKTLSISIETAKQMCLIIKSSKTFELLVQDKNAEIANVAQEVLTYVDSIDF